MTKLPNELKPQTLIKRVMSGNKSKEYLDAFSKLSSTDLHHPDFSRLQIIELWNSLQKTPNKVRYFTFSLTDNNSFIQKRINEVYNHDKWAYILHDKDNSAERKHYHYYLEFKNPRSFSSIANDLEIPVTMLQKVYNKNAMLDYLTHENDPNKHHYDIADIVSNFDIEDEKKKDNDIDPWTEFQDYLNVKTGIMSVQDWFDKYNYVLCDIKNMNQRQQLYDRMSQYVRYGRACPRSEFAVPNPRSSPPISIKFKNLDPNKVDYIDKGSGYQI